MGAVIGILDHYEIPIQIRYAFLREVLSTKKLHLFYSGNSYGHILVNKGFRQGSPEASFVFAIIVAHLLAVLDRSWKPKGWGVRLGRWGGSDISFDAWWSDHHFLFDNLTGNVQDVWLTSLAFLDDVYFAAPTLTQGQQMLDEAISLFGRVGLKPNLTKIKWIANKYIGVGACNYLVIDSVRYPRSEYLEVLGSLIRADIKEIDAFRHRIGKAWGVFYKWQHVLTCSGPLKPRVAFWNKVDAPSLLWGLQTCRQPTSASLGHLKACQHMMLKKMMRTHRRKGEYWLDWHIRALTSARDLASSYSIGVEQLLRERREKWAGHLIRLGHFDGVSHAVKYVLSWRPLPWWRDQQIFNAVTLDLPIRHPTDWGLPRRWEDSFEVGWALTFGRKKQD